jgi:aromatic-L-amino-acid/L-tryptophan decarboxylase
MQFTQMIGGVALSDQLEPNRRLQLSREEMRDLGYQIVDMIIDHVESVPDKFATRTNNRPQLEAILREPLPEHATPYQDVLQSIQDHVFSNMMHQDHPRYFAFISGPGNYVSAMADALAAGFNVFAGTWMEASGPAMIEIMAVDWLRQMVGFPESAGGLFVSGGSQANLHALSVARHVKLDDKLDDAIVYFSDQAHSSIERGLRVLGFQREQIYKIHSTENYQIDLTDLRRAVAEHRAKGLRPFCVIANVGGTNTGVIDPLDELADFCKEENLWLHGDAAYGGAVALSRRKAHLLKGVDRLDSITIDPHKWLFQPFECGCVIVRNRRYLRDTFRLVPEYLKDIDRQPEEEVNFFDYGVQLSRGFRALKVWMSLKVFGVEAFRQAVDWGIELAEFAERTLRNTPNWEITSPAWIGIVSFRYYRDDALTPEEEDEINQLIVDQMTKEGYAFVSTTILKERKVVRMCIINPRTTQEDILGTIERMTRYGEALAAQYIAGATV